MKLVLLVVLVIAIAGCVSQSQSAQVILSTGTGQKTVSAEIADNMQEWEAGLMNRSSLPENDGMIFIFPDSQQRIFWMKDTLIPLDMIFISDRFEVADITTMEPCRADPCPSYTSKLPARYVLEVNAGYAKENNVTTGSRVAFHYLVK
jgi:hypothetical protein